MSGVRFQNGKLSFDFPLHLAFREPSPHALEKPSPVDAVLGVMIGRASESFHFSLFAIAAVLAFPAVFFPFVLRPQGILYGCLILAFALLTRPVGTWAFKALQRRWSRTARIISAFCLLGVLTAGIALLPGYRTLGFNAIAWLALLRSGQGVALGGAWGEAAGLLPLHAPLFRRGSFAMLAHLGAPVGFLLAGGLFAALLTNLTAEEFEDWGWRFPFFISLAINMVSLFARLRLVPADTYLYFPGELEQEPEDPGV